MSQPGSPAADGLNRCQSCPDLGSGHWGAGFGLFGISNGEEGGSPALDIGACSLAASPAEGFVRGLHRKSAFDSATPPDATLAAAADSLRDIHLQDTSETGSGATSNASNISNASDSMSAGCAFNTSFAQQDEACGTYGDSLWAGGMSDMTLRCSSAPPDSFCEETALEQKLARCKSWPAVLPDIQSEVSEDDDDDDACNEVAMDLDAFVVAMASGEDNWEDRDDDEISWIMPQQGQEQAAGDAASGESYGSMSGSFAVPAKLPGAFTTLVAVSQ
eukprot:TRINITY_DN1788_c1_g1_i1.p1 TRINITY_DN1788_c1_g1~~TRINITY_DN1788_c1_g1_i1.p1  ORF type:complete len:275 (+),score=69.19 TRINITY_DN1788_c1_g1_i1:106-930(+)